METTARYGIVEAIMFLVF